ncbi:hypothetical protein COCNU_07G014300 [Cocos nucifera]|uniref:Uncharacterized protein n=1 Tax=Cocos nucifera TaxID=13894 RepID=A0A8K0IHL0_COCNU|nr:hypothetical protein COCNU_07G014300 [Cocos nucifera]
MAKSILETMIRAVEEFKISPKMQNLNVEFGQKAFIKNFDLYEGRVARMFLELDLSFLKEEEDDVDAGPSNAIVELAFGPSEPVAEAPEPIRKPEAAESDPAQPFVVPPEVEILE